MHLPKEYDNDYKSNDEYFYEFNSCYSFSK